MKVTGIRENPVNKKAIYFGIYDDDWCDSVAVENFSENIIDLIEVRRYSRVSSQFSRHIKSR